MNVGNYFIGVAVGVTYYNLKKAKRDISKIFVRKDFIQLDTEKLKIFILSSASGSRFICALSSVS